MGAVAGAAEGAAAGGSSVTVIAWNGSILRARALWSSPTLMGELTFGPSEAARSRLTRSTSARVLGDST